MGNIYKERIEALRDYMRSKGWDAVIIGGSDPHNSEYPAERWKQVEWLSGFTGEAGEIVVTADHAGLWTDTRYFIQAVMQLEGTGVELNKTRVPEQVLIPEWLEQQFGQEGVIAIDGICTSVAAARSLPGSIISVPDLLDCFWTDRPGIPQTPIFSIEAGRTRSEKIEWARDFLRNKGYDGILLTSLDEIAWMLNVRASDIEYNPLVISYLLISQEELRWYVLKDEVEDPESEATFSILDSEGIQILPYSDINYLAEDFQGRLFVDSSSLNYGIFSLLEAAQISLVEGESPVGLQKAVKNDFEIEGMKKAQLKDAVAMESYLYWLEKNINEGVEISEWDAAVKLGKLRAKDADYRDDSFETISAFGAGAALPHYITPKENAPLIGEDGLYLCDSGGQYLCGTTDITRTVPFGECSRLEKEDYTLVLKAHIDLAMAVFPAGTAGCQIDALAREPLWRAMRNFGHGTGHGIGCFLGVHEGPQDIRQNFNRTALLPGMITSNEPGIYREGLHGVRHENLMLCVEKGSNEFGRWLEFETITLCHFDTRAVLVELLGSEEIEWLNAYNERVYDTLKDLLPAEVAEWLREKTKAISASL